MTWRCGNTDRVEGAYRAASPGYTWCCANMPEPAGRDSPPEEKNAPDAECMRLYWCQMEQIFHKAAAQVLTRCARGSDCLTLIGMERGSRPPIGHAAPDYPHLVCHMMICTC
mmetsp:Transcript_60745/g.108397  ORF Transcript_60745/g.108397 Transcript_60745/m.108397 type:complete len:112 (-) Transcript_60745:410-745(-)